MTTTCGPRMSQAIDGGPASHAPETAPNSSPASGIQLVFGFCTLGPVLAGGLKMCRLICQLDPGLSDPEQNRLVSARFGPLGQTQTVHGMDSEVDCATHTLHAPTRRPSPGKN